VVHQTSRCTAPAPQSLEHSDHALSCHSHPKISRHHETVGGASWEQCAEFQDEQATERFLVPVPQSMLHFDQFPAIHLQAE